MSNPNKNNDQKAMRLTIIDTKHNVLTDAVYEGSDISKYPSPEKWTELPGFIQNVRGTIKDVEEGDFDDTYRITIE